MRVFVTGVTGFVGAAVVEELLVSGHQVLGLVRTDAAAAAFQALGGEAHRGTLEDLAALRSGALAADAVVHTAFNHDFEHFAKSCTLDRNAIHAMGDAIAGSNRVLVVTAGVTMATLGRVATESDPAPTPSNAWPRASEIVAGELSSRGVRVAIVRLPPSVHGVGDHGFIPMLINIAVKNGVSAYIGNGMNRWPAVHRFDAAAVYRLVLERGVTPGDRFHAVSEEGIPFKDIAAAIGRQLGLPLVSIAPENAADHFGWLSMFAEMDTPASSTLTRRALDWNPKQLDLISDVSRSWYQPDPGIPAR